MSAQTPETEGTWPWAFGHLCSGGEVFRACHGDNAYVYRRRSAGGEYRFEFVRLNDEGKVVFEMKWKPDYDDLVATDWRLRTGGDA